MGVVPLEAAQERGAGLPGVGGVGGVPGGEGESEEGVEDAGVTGVYPSVLLRVRGAS